MALARPSNAARTPVEPPPKAGDIYVLKDKHGYWIASLRFLRFSAPDQAEGVFQQLSDGKEIHCELRWLSRLRPTDVVGADPNQTESPRRPASDGKSPYSGARSHASNAQRQRRACTPAQRSFMVTLARRKGIDLDELRRLARVDSLHSLSIAQASALIERLKGD